MFSYSARNLSGEELSIILIRIEEIYFLGKKTLIYLGNKKITYLLLL